MIRNHQYKGSKFIYTVGADRDENYNISRFTCLYEGVSFSSLPADFRFNWAGLPEDLDVETQ